MSGFMMFLAWVVCVVAGTALFVTVVNLNASWRTWGWPRHSRLRCPECGGEYHRIPHLLPHQPPYVDPPRKPPRRPPLGPAAWEFTCASCGLHVVYGKWGKVKRTFRQPPPGWWR